MKKANKSKENPKHLKDVKGTKNDELDVKGSSKGFSGYGRKGDPGYDGSRNESHNK